jgi:hypothetical protein
MKISEVVIDEAISVSHYSQALAPVITAGVHEAIGLVRNIKGRETEAEASFADDDGSHARFKAIVIYEISANLDHVLRKKIKDSLNKSCGVPVIEDLFFTTMTGSTRGWAQDRDIALSAKYLDSIAKRSAEVLFNSVYDSYSSEERIDGFYFMCRSIGTGDRYLSSFIDDAIKKTVSSLVSTSVHELVHVLQHNKQLNKGRDETEYRSYLDKRKGEFADMVNKSDQTPGQVTDNNERYYNLYLASPQEIPAFAHQAALNIIRDFGFDDSDHPGDLQIASVREFDIVDAVNKITSTRFSAPKTPKEAMVRKRYIKLVYQEVARYLQQRLAQLKSK